jgi:hypothetical protein
VSALGHTAHRDVVASASLPRLAVQEPSLSQHRFALMGGPRLTVSFVAETFGHGVRSGVVESALAVCLSGTKPVERKVQDRRSHLASDPASPEI